MYEQQPEKVEESEEEKKASKESQKALRKKKAELDELEVAARAKLDRIQKLKEELENED